MTNTFDVVYLNFYDGLQLGVLHTMQCEQEVSILYECMIQLKRMGSYRHRNVFQLYTLPLQGCSSFLWRQSVVSAALFVGKN